MSVKGEREEERGGCLEPAVWKSLSEMPDWYSALSIYRVGWWTMFTEHLSLLFTKDVREERLRIEDSSRGGPATWRLQIDSESLPIKPILYENYFSPSENVLLNTARWSVSIISPSVYFVTYRFCCILSNKLHDARASFTFTIIRARSRDDSKSCKWRNLKISRHLLFSAASNLLEWTLGRTKMRFLLLNKRTKFLGLHFPN